jgi:hypothetical protein
MRRFLLATAFAALAVAVATPANAGYLVVRVILDATDAVPGVGDPGSGPVIEGGFNPKGGRFGVGSGPVSGGGFQGIPGREGPIGPIGPMGPAAPAGPAPHDPTRSIVVVLPVTEDLTKKHPFNPANPANAFNPLRDAQLRLTHRGEKFVTNLFADNTSVQWYDTLKLSPAFLRTHAGELKTRYETWARNAKAGKADPKGAFDLTLDALRMGLADEAVTYADAALAAAGKPDGLPPEVAGFVRAYGAVQKAVKAPAAKPRADVEGWKVRLEAARVDTSPHYVLLSWDATDEEVKRRLDLLEENYKAFFLVHATRGVEVRPPDAPLVAVLAKQARDAVVLSRALDGPARLPADGFYSPEHDVLVLSPDRVDSLGQSFDAMAQQVYRDGLAKKDLLAGRAPKVEANGQNGLRRPDEGARLQTIALVDRLAEEASAVAAVSREGTLQLLYATGRLPRHVSLPGWLTDGAAATFTRPRDPAFTTDGEGKWWMTVSTGAGYGGPNYVQHRYLRDLLDKKELDPDRAALLRNVLTDAYFLGLRDPRNVLDPDPPVVGKVGVEVGGKEVVPPAKGPFGVPMDVGPPAAPVPPAEDLVALQRKKRERLAVKAHATAWGLYYYLSRDKPAELAKFTAELSGYPRDLPLDGPTVTAAFCRAFGLDGSPKSLKEFADGWLEYMSVAQVGHDIPLVEPKPPMPAVDPMNPMGIPPRPGVQPNPRP